MGILQALSRSATITSCVLFAVCPLQATAEQASLYDQVVPEAVRGPFVSKPEVVTKLDCPTDECKGPFSFTQLMEARMTPADRTAHAGNPFNSKIGRPIRDVITGELKALRKSGYAPGQRLNEELLTDDNSRIELVGIVNRMDRQFVKDPSVGISKDQQGCGEISAIYRVFYSIRNGNQQSRLPATLNLVFPALPFPRQGNSLKCQEVARRWLKEAQKPAGRSVEQEIADLLDPNEGPLSLIDGRDLLRVELNLQEYRIKASNDETNFGSEAAYLLRVFRWVPSEGEFQPSFLRNQIDRAKVLGNASTKRALIDFLLQDDTIASIDTGTLEIPFKLENGAMVLAERALSISPGGIHRSGNQPFWNAPTLAEQILSDEQIDAALRRLKARKVPLSFIKNVEDFRLRLNEQSCTGCHQTRAIAGFHFPGADRDGTPVSNSVLLPGSAHFYGDQPRRMKILELMASRSNAKLNEYELAASYADRPLNKFSNKLKGTDLLGGWGGACLIPNPITPSQREWNCTGSLQCVSLFQAGDEGKDGLGTCAPPENEKQVGDYLQIGRVETKAFGHDRYKRKQPPFIGEDDPRITALPQNPPGNSYYGAHQEYYEGFPKSWVRDVKRDAQTGGFPAGMLRLSECKGLPNEASCGLVASSGFNDCIKLLATDQNVSVKDCFNTFTSYAGLRACSAASPCRDDYICVKPMGYRPDTARAMHDARDALLANSNLFETVNGRPYKSPDYYGQDRPDDDWIAKDDPRGLCIPPYFVFQFRADGHPAP